jgi:hypothetical protein
MLGLKPTKGTVAVAIVLGTAAWLSFGILAIVDPTGVRIGILPSAWVLLALILIVFAIVVYVAPSQRIRLTLVLSLLPVFLPWIPLPIPDLFLAWTGPIVWFLWGAVALWTLSRAVRRRVPRRLTLHSAPGLTPWYAAGLAFATFLAVHTYAKGPPGGDEPHYLIIAQSILKDGDIRIDNNYSQKDYLKYWGGFLRPHFSSPAVDGEHYSGHAPGLPAITAPAFGAFGYWGVVVWLGGLSALGSASVWKVGYVASRDQSAAWFAWAAVTLTTPVVFHGTLVYPDAIGGALLAAGMLGLVVMDERTRVCSGTHDRSASSPIAWSTWRSMSVGLAVGLLPWLHTRLAVPAAFLACVLLLRFRAAARVGAAARRDIVALVSPIAVSLLGWFAFFWFVYGSANPSAPYGDQSPVDGALVAVGLLGLAFDQEFGILLNAPVHLLWAAGLWAVFRRNRRLALELLMIIVPYVLVSSGHTSSGHHVWYAGASPPARFLVPVTFVLGVAFAALWSTQTKQGRAMSATLLALSVLIVGALAFGADGALAYNTGSGRARWLGWIAPLVDLSRALPSFFRGGGASLTPRPSALLAHLVNPAIVWTVSLFCGWLLYRWLGRQLGDDGRLIAAPSCVLAVFALGTSAGWSVAVGDHTTPTRSQLRLLRGLEAQNLPLGIRLPAAEPFPASKARAYLQLTTSRLENPPAGSLLYLTDVPAGDYVLRVPPKAYPRGDLFLGIGRATGVAWRWSVASGQTITSAFHLPVRASSIVVNGDERSTESVEGLALVPLGPSQQHANGDGRQARDAARYGQVVVFATDDRILLDPRGFWVLGRREPEVIFLADSAVNGLELEVENVTTPNRIGLQAGRWSTERVLAAGETWRVRVPVLGLGPSYAVRFKVANGVQTSNGLLGCRVELR